MAELTAKGRNQISEGSFALPGRRYPIHDAAHARNALARVAQHGTPAEKTQVREAVNSKYPDIGTVKEAKIFGAKPDTDRLLMAALPYSARRKEYVKYLNKKAKEKPSDLLLAGSGGALAGGILGGLTGLAAGARSKGMLVGLLIGALGGGLYGLLVRAADKRDIATCKRILRKGNIDPSLADFIVRNERARRMMKDFEEMARHAQTQGKLDRIEGKLASVEGSLCSAIAGTINESDFARFNETFSDPNARRMIEKSAEVMECLNRITAEPITDTEKLASAAEASFKPGYDVVQIRPNGYGYTVKISSAPNRIAPQEENLTVYQARELFSPDILKVADEEGAATLTDVEAQPDPLTEQAAPATSFGMYKVTDPATGRQLVGYVIPGLFDPVSGQPSQLSLFTNGSSYALQPQITGSLVGINFNLPTTDGVEPRGHGIFFKTDGKALIATVPYTIANKVMLEGKEYLAARDMNGADIRLVKSEGIAKPVATSPEEIVLPADYQFLPLENEIQLAGGEELMKAAQAHAHETMGVIRAWDGGCTLGGPVFEKVGSGEHNWVDGAFWLAAAGVPQNVSVEVFNKAASSNQPIRLFGLQSLSTVDEVVKEANLEALEDMSLMRIPERRNLLLEMAAITFDKEASAMVDIASVDAVLALNFLNPENVETFVEHLPQLEETTAKLASLVLATQLGLQAVPKTAAVRAMFALEDVISGLKSLKTYSV